MRTPEIVYLQLQKILESADRAEDAFSRMLPALGEFLGCDRCFLYLRNPATAMGKVIHCWCRSPQIPKIVDLDWKMEPDTLKNDPLFVAALRTDPSVFVEDVETANPEVVNREFEHENFGHRALIHAHLCENQQLWGILQPSVFGQPKAWSQADQIAIEQVVAQLTPLAVTYVKAVNP
jgi:GAF domain-containing protein